MMMELHEPDPGHNHTHDYNDDLRDFPRTWRNRGLERHRFERRRRRLPPPASRRRIRWACSSPPSRPRLAAGTHDNRARRIAEARMKGYEGDAWRRLRELHPGAQRHLHEMRKPAARRAAAAKRTAWCTPSDRQDGLLECTRFRMFEGYVTAQPIEKRCPVGRDSRTRQWFPSSWRGKILPLIVGFAAHVWIGNGFAKLGFV